MLKHFVKTHDYSSEEECLYCMLYPSFNEFLGQLDSTLACVPCFPGPPLTGGIIPRIHYSSLHFWQWRRSEDLHDRRVSGLCAKKYMHIDISTSKGGLHLLLIPQEMQQDSSEDCYYNPQKSHNQRNKRANGIFRKSVNICQSGA